MTRIRFDGRDRRIPSQPPVGAPVRHLRHPTPVRRPRPPRGAGALACALESRASCCEPGRRPAARPATTVAAVPGLDADSLRARLADARLYLCTDARRDAATSPSSPTRRSPAASTSSSCATRAPTGRWRRATSWRRWRCWREACARHGALLAVNDRADVALAAGADVLHLGQDDLPVAWARKVVGDEVIVGRSAHSAAETAAAADEPGVDYFCAGPCWPTPTKPGRPGAGARPRAHRGRPGAGAAVVRDRRDRRRPARRGAGARGPTGWSSCGRSPRPTTRARRPRRWPPGCAPDFPPPRSHASGGSRPGSRPSRTCSCGRLLLVGRRGGPAGPGALGRSPPSARAGVGVGVGVGAGAARRRRRGVSAPKRPRPALGAALLRRLRGGPCRLRRRIRGRGLGLVAFALRSPWPRPRVAEDRAERRPPERCDVELLVFSGEPFTSSIPVIASMPIANITTVNPAITSSRRRERRRDRVATAAAAPSGAPVRTPPT